MTMRNSLNDREYDKFIDCPIVPGNPMMRVSSNTEATRWRHCIKTIDFNGTTYGGIGTFTVFTVTGMVKCKIYCYCTDTLVSAGTATLRVGTALSTTGLIGASTVVNAGVAVLTAGLIWVDSSPASIELSTASSEKILTGTAIASVGGATITDGTLVFDLVWLPLTTDGNVS